MISYRLNAFLSLHLTYSIETPKEFLTAQQVHTITTFTSIFGNGLLPLLLHIRPSPLWECWKYNTTVKSNYRY